MHPLVRREERLFRAAARRRGKAMVLLDIPLLFETGGDRKMHATITVSAPHDVQVARVRRRGTMSDAQITAVIGKQMPDAQKRRRADYVIRTGLSRFETVRSALRVMRSLRE